LITGESGTGKEIAARQIHLKSPRSERHFVAINCSAIPENLLESELFGHKKGAFTGATNDKEGLFLIAHGGTLFLDEIGEMPKTLQVKLLRALQEREVTPVGATASIRVDVRIIAATNRDILSAVEKGEFRKDLYYRINVVELKMPPLREHAVDIPSLAQHFVQKYAIELGRAVKGINFEALKKLTFYAWPGNVRELENVIERAIILNKEAEWIALSDLPSGFQNLGEEANNPYNLDDAIRTVSRTFIANALEAAGGDKKKAAGLLGMGLSSLYRKLEELGISSSREPGSQ
ncbi:MAG: sigma-54-dependent Fis family transcriptional regulator, partial [Deltaproteobacteria bacterium]|nr:sigma-54-dependent Fis family transcriptional regulator [Deltaproteobacteria bacterium]